MSVQTFVRMFLLVFMISSGEAIEDEVSTSDAQSSSRSSLPQSYPSCFTEETTWSVDELVDIVEDQSLYSCQDICLESPNCHHFTWYNQLSVLHSTCVLFGSTTAEFPCTNCVSGPESCTCGDQFSCQYTEDNFVGEFPHVDIEILCQDHCFNSDLCQFYSWLDKDDLDFPNVCFMFSSCDEKLFGCNTCHSGLANCGNISVITSTTRSSNSTSMSSSTTTTPTTTSPTTPPHPTCDTPKPPNHGDWFCPPSISPSTCHLECDPGYVSNNETVITCLHGEWSSAPSCVAAVALITGTTSVEIYSEQLHKKLPDLPDNRFWHSLDVVNSLVLLCGGYFTERSCLTLTSSHHWTLHSYTRMERAYHSSVSMLGQLHLLGGDYSESSTEYLDLPSAQWHQSWDLLQDTSYACSAKIGPETFLTTGSGSSVVSYNVTSGVATRLQDLITGRNSHGCVYLKEPTTGSGRVLVVGGGESGRIHVGGGDQPPLSSSEMYNIATGEWATTGELTTGKFGVRMVVLGDNVLAMGGEDSHGNSLSSVDRFNWTSLQWTATENMLQGRDLHAVTGVPPSAVGIGHK